MCVCVCVCVYVCLSSLFCVMDPWTPDSSSIFFNHRNLSIVISINFVSYTFLLCVGSHHIILHLADQSSMSFLFPFTACSIFILSYWVLGEALKLVFQFIDSVFCPIYFAIHHFTSTFTFENFHFKAFFLGSRLIFFLQRCNSEIYWIYNCMYCHVY